MKNIVICCDGTGNEISENISNVLKLYRTLRKTEKTTPVWERCLSIPGLHGKVPRYLNIHIRYQTLDGKTESYDAHSSWAALLQHEVVWIGAGSASHMAAIAPADLQRLARARACELVGRG